MTAKPIVVGAGTGGRGTFEVHWARDEPVPNLGWHPAMPRRRPTPPLKRGDHVLYRSNDWFEPIDAEVVDPLADPNHPDMQWSQPWPIVLLKITPEWPEHKLDVSGHRLAGAAGPRPYLIKTQEARLVGTAGWLPLDHETRAYPEIGF